MSQKKVLVVYYSRTGTTRKVAEAVARKLDCDLEELVDTKKRSGALGLIGAGADAHRKKLTVLGELECDPAAYELVVVGTPVWAGTMTPAIRTYLTEHKEGLPQVAFFLTTGGSGVERTFEDMREVCAKEPVATLALTAKQVRRQQFAQEIEGFVGRITE